jgi:endonuclease YncB( thermonuclease family)
MPKNVWLLCVVSALAWPALGWAQAAAPSVTIGPAQGTPLPLDFDARVTRVADGDTLWVKPLAGGGYRKLRLDGLDAPEVCQTGGPAARDALASHVLFQVVSVRVRAWDSYGRALAQVHLGADDVAAALVRHGHAWSSRWQGGLGPYAAEETEARAQRKGVFAQEGSETPRDFRRRYGPCPWP